MCKLRLLIVILMLSLLRHYTFAQDTQKLHLSIDNMFDLIERHNKDLKTAKTAVEVSNQDCNVAKAQRLPDISASISVSYNGDATLMDRDFSNAMKAESPHFGNKLNLNLYQPLYMGGAITGGISLAEAQTHMANIALDNTRNNMRITAISCYLNLFKSRNLLQVYNENISLTEKLIKNMEVNGSQGIVLKNDITRYELRLSTLKYDRTTVINSIKILNHDLCSHLGLDQSTEIIPDSTILNIELPCDGVSYWKDLSVSNSIALKSVNAEKEIVSQNDKLARAEMLPHIGIIAGNTLDGPITYEVPPIDKNINYWWVGLNISYNFSSLYKTNKKRLRNKLELSRLSDKQEATEADVDRNIEQAYTLYTQAHEMLATQLKNVELATENYRIVNKRFSNQLALLTDMLDASTAKLDAETRLVNAKINTLYYYYQLKFISGIL